MACQNRQSDFNLKERLTDSGSEFSFTQAYRLVRMLLKEENQLNDSLVQQIHIRPELSLEFPCSDIAAIEEVMSADNASGYQITATFLGLYGTSSPLPTFYTENLFREQSEDNLLNREFIDIFNNHLYHIFFKIWSSHRVGYKLFEEKDSRYLSYLYSLGGLANISTRQLIPEEYNPLRYLGILGHLPRSAYGLRTLLSDLLDVKQIKIVECQDKILPIPIEQRLCLGIDNIELGETTHLGEQIISTDQAFTIQIGPVPYKVYTRLLPHTDKFNLLNRMVKLYIDQQLIWDIELSVLGAEAPGIALGKSEGTQLGYNSWLFSEKRTRDFSYTVKLGDHDSL